jgi:hypothetical protein
LLKKYSLYLPIFLDDATTQQKQKQKQMDDSTMQQIDDNLPPVHNPELSTTSNNATTAETNQMVLPKLDLGSPLIVPKLGVLTYEKFIKEYSPKECNEMQSLKNEEKDSINWLYTFDAVVKKASTHFTIISMHQAQQPKEYYNLKILYSICRKVNEKLKFAYATIVRPLLELWSENYGPETPNPFPFMSAFEKYIFFVSNLVIDYSFFGHPTLGNIPETVLLKRYNDIIETLPQLHLAIQSLFRLFSKITWGLNNQKKEELYPMGKKRRAYERGYNAYLHTSGPPPMPLPLYWETVVAFQIIENAVFLYYLQKIFRIANSLGANSSWKNDKQMRERVECFLNKETDGQMDAATLPF